MWQKNNGNLSKNTKLSYDFNYVIISIIFNNIINILFVCDNSLIIADHRTKIEVRR
jgi:hypothetical protein